LAAEKDTELHNQELKTRNSHYKVTKRKLGMVKYNFKFENKVKRHTQSQLMPCLDVENCLKDQTG
jgi:hypothetical protein